MTELLSHNFILNTSNIIVLVVDQVGIFDQKLINRIQSDFYDKIIIVVHNLKNLEDIECVEAHIKTNIQDYFFNFE